MKPPVKHQKKRFLLATVVFALIAIAIEQAGTSLKMYVYADALLHVFNVPLIIVIYWVVIGYTSWMVYRKFGWIAGVLTGVTIDLPAEVLAFHLGWWTWIPSGTPAIFFNAPVANFLVYLIMSLWSILIYKYMTKPKM